MEMRLRPELGFDALFRGDQWSAWTTSRRSRSSRVATHTDSRGGFRRSSRRCTCTRSRAQRGGSRGTDCSQRPDAGGYRYRRRRSLPVEVETPQLDPHYWYALHPTRWAAATWNMLMTAMVKTGSARLPR